MLTMAFFKDPFYFILRKTKARRNRYLQTVMKDRLIPTTLNRLTQVVQKITEMPRMTIEPYNSRMRELAVAVMGWRQSCIVATAQTRKSCR